MCQHVEDLIFIILLSGLHLEIDPRGGGVWGTISNYEKEGWRNPVYMFISTCTSLGESGGRHGHNHTISSLYVVYTLLVLICDITTFGLKYLLAASL